MTAFVDMSKNYSFYSLPIAYFLALLPGVYSKSQASGTYDLASPRSYQEAVQKDEKLDKMTKNRIMRAEAATANGQETLSIFMLSVVAANVSGVPASTINTLCATYLGSRVVYNAVYIWLQENRKFAPLRSLVWNVSMISWMTLLVKAGNRVFAASS
ncbi:Uu.00g081040.m01.CDS01 [Anthostomella pinea]|uniref:Uu.00g081040.m01.CDS01 n=1 Tax=Anthostomella pinea TaxID=933095 RepID=A0AAI8YJI0_9PEZI|nr:Uu.00g081040.m01.CDS01 [Anthostomella pinea]